VSFVLEHTSLGEISQGPVWPKIKFFKVTSSLGWDLKVSAPSYVPFLSNFTSNNFSAGRVAEDSRTEHFLMYLHQF
jgi:hypothetical protein